VIVVTMEEENDLNHSRIPKEMTTLLLARQQQVICNGSFALGIC